MSTKPDYVLLTSADGKRWVSLPSTTYVDTVRGTLEGTGQCMYDGRSLPTWLDTVYEVRDGERAPIWSRNDG